MHSRTCTLLSTLSAALALATTPAMVGAQPEVPRTEKALGGNLEPGADQPNLRRFYTGYGEQGRFEGKLVCLRSDGGDFIAAEADQCPSDRRVYALDMDSPDVLQPLLATTEQVHDRLRGLIGEQIVIQGRNYPSVGVMAAESVWRENDESELY